MAVVFALLIPTLHVGMRVRTLRVVSVRVDE